MRDSPAEKGLLGRRRNKLDPKTMCPFVVIANHGHTLDIEVNGIPECIASDRVRPAPRRVEPQKSDVPDTESVRDEIEKPAGRTNSSSRLPVSRLPSTPKTAQDKPVSSVKPIENSTAPKTPEEFVIEKLEKLGEDRCGKKDVFVKWYQFAKEENTWEPIDDSNIPAPLLARFLKSRKARNVTQLLGSPP